MVPRIGKYKRPEVAPKDRVNLLDPIRARGAEVQANRTLAVVRRMFNLAVERGELEHSPATHIKANLETSRDRVLSREAIRRLVVALDSRNLWPATRDALERILRTAQRPGEVLNLEWADVGWDRRVWILPKEKVKNGQTHVVPLHLPSDKLAAHEFQPQPCAGLRPMASRASPRGAEAIFSMAPFD